MENGLPCKNKPKNARVFILPSDKTNFKTENLSKEGHFIVIKRLVLNEWINVFCKVDEGWNFEERVGKETSAFTDMSWGI